MSHGSIRPPATAFVSSAGMDFTWTPEQEALREQAREVASGAVARFGRHNDSWINGYSEEFAEEMAALGWIGLTWPTEFGGGGRPEKRDRPFRVLVVEDNHHVVEMYEYALRKLRTPAGAVSVDVRFATNKKQKISELMTHENLVTVSEGISKEEAKKLLHKHRIEKLLVVDKKYHCIGLITVKDIEKAVKFPEAAKDAKGRLRVGAATGTGIWCSRSGPGFALVLWCWPSRWRPGIAA